MATIQKRRNKGGSTSFVAWVRVQPFKPVARAFKSRAEASAWADDHARELREHRSRGDADADLTRLTLAQLAREYLDDSEVRTLGDYATIEQRLAWWVEHYGTVRVLRLGAITLRKAREKLKPGRKPSTVNRYLSIMRACWNWGRATELIPLKLVWPPRLMLKEPPGIVRYLSDDELYALLKAAAQYSLVMYVAILFSIATGVRMSELRRFRWADIEFDRQHIRILLTKNHESRGGYLSATAVPALQRLKQQSAAGIHVFIQEDGQPVSKDWISYRWTIIRSSASLVNFRWHDLRHSCASLLAQNGSNLLEIGSVLGHKSPASTKRYAHLVEHAPVTGHPQLDEKLRSSAYLRERQGRSYSVERETRVVEEKEPDARFRAKASDASVAMEIKVMKSWSLRELEEALSDQLVGRYLRDRNHRHGILLLVHQRKRSKGWRNARGRWLTVHEVFDHLRKRAETISSGAPQSPQPRVQLVDVSTVALPKRFVSRTRGRAAAKSTRAVALKQQPSRRGQKPRSGRAGKSKTRAAAARVRKKKQRGK